MNIQEFSKITKNLLQSRFLIWLSVISIGIFYTLTLREGHNWAGDFSQYILHAKAIAEGRQYLDINYISNSFAFVSPGAYPPVFPLLLAPVYFLYGLHLTAFKIVMLMTFCLSLYFIHKTFQENLSKSAVLILFFVVGFNPYLWNQRDNILSDFPFLLFCFMSLHLMQQTYCLYLKNNSMANTTNIQWLSCLLGIVMYLAYGTREIGLVLPLTIIAYELVTLRRLTRVSIIAISIFAVLAALQYYGLKGTYLSPTIQQKLAKRPSEYGAGSNHADFFSFDINQIMRQVKRYADVSQEFWLYGSWDAHGTLQTLGWRFFRVFSLLALVGYVMVLFKKISVLEIFPAGYMAVLFLFGGFEGLRYMIPVMPFIIYYAFFAIQSIKITNAGKIKLVTTCTFCLVIITLYTYSFYNNKDQLIESGISSPEAMALWSFINDNTHPEDTFVFKKPRVFSLMTQRTTSAYPRNKDPKFIVQYLNAIEADYLVTINSSYKGRGLTITHHDSFFNSGTPSYFSIAFANDYFSVYRYKIPPNTNTKDQP